MTTYVNKSVHRSERDEDAPAATARQETNPMKTTMELHPDELERHPQLALLKSLHHTIEATMALFTVVHTEIYFDDHRRYWEPPPSASSARALALVEAMAAADNAIGAYVAQLSKERDAEAAQRNSQPGPEF